MEMNDKEMSSCEKIIMKVVWDSNDDISTMEIIEILRKKYEKDYARTTVVTFIQRLAEKGYVSTYRKGRESYVHALRDEKQYKEKMLKNIKDFWFKGDSTALLEMLFENNKPTKAEINELRNIVDEFDN